jgi:hypothetical protein
VAVSDLPILKYVEINAVDVSSYVGTFEVKEEFDQNIRTATIVLKSTVSTILDYNDDELVGSEVVIKRGVTLATEKILFQGFVRKIEFSGGIVTIRCEDKLSQAKYTTINTSFHKDIDPEAGVISDIFLTLINDYSELTADATTVQASGAVNIIDKLVIRQRALIDVLLELAYTLDWQFYYNPEDDKVYFEPMGYTSAATFLTVGDNVVKLPKWDIDSSELFNKIVVKGSQQEILTQEGPYILDGVAQPDWNTTSVTLDRKPKFVKVFCDTSNPPTTEKVGGVSGSTGTYDYEVDVDTKRIIWNTTTFTPTTSYYTLVDFSYNIPIQVTRKRAASITTYSGGVPKSVSQFRDELKTVAEAELWASKQLDMYSVPFYKTNLAIRSVPDLNVGTLYTVVDNVQNINRELMVKSIRYVFPYRYDEVVVADKDYRTANWGINTRQRIKKLEEKNADTEELITQFIDLSHSIHYRRKSIQVYKKTIAGSTGIYGHPVQGIYGLAYYGQSGMIWGHSKFGVWDFVNWGTVTTSFILGHPIAGILGTSELGEGNPTQEVLVYEKNYTY